MALDEAGFAKLDAIGLSVMRSMPADIFDGCYDGLQILGMDFSSPETTKALHILGKYFSGVAEVGADLKGEDNPVVLFASKLALSLTACAAYARTCHVVPEDT